MSMQYIVPNINSYELFDILSDCDYLKNVITDTRTSIIIYMNDSITLHLNDWEHSGLTGFDILKNGPNNHEIVAIRIVEFINKCGYNTHLVPEDSDEYFDYANDNGDVDIVRNNM